MWKDKKRHTQLLLCFNFSSAMTKQLIGHILNHQSALVLNTWHKVIIHVGDGKSCEFPNTLNCTLPWPGLAWLSSAQLQKSVPPHTATSSALSAIRLPLLLLQPITQDSLCCAKSCSCSNPPGKSSLKHVRMRGPVW